jgi:hypothetical protein
MSRSNNRGRTKEKYHKNVKNYLAPMGLKFFLESTSFDFAKIRLFPSYTFAINRLTLLVHDLHLDEIVMLM